MRSHAGRTIGVAGVVAAIAGAPVAAAAQAVTMDLQSLEAVPGVLVVVDGVTAEAEADGLSRDSLRVDIEAMLAAAGVAVLTEPEWQQLIGNPALVLDLHLAKPSPHLYLYGGTLELRQLTVLIRDSTKAAFTRTWAAAEILGTKPTGKLPALREEIRPLVDRFISDYRDAIARRGGPPPLTPRRWETVVAP